jgi:hypothetical protein
MQTKAMTPTEMIDRDVVQRHVRHRSYARVTKRPGSLANNVGRGQVG